MDPLQVFVSSRLACVFADPPGYYCSELLPDRAVAFDTIRQMGFKPSGFECIPASHMPAEAAYLAEVSQADIAVFLIRTTLGQGVVDEFRAAERRGIPRLLFVKKTPGPECRSPECEAFLQEHLPDLKVDYYETLEELQRKLRDSLLALVTDGVRRSPFKRFSQYTLYSEVVQICKQTRHRLHLAQRSSSLFFPSKFLPGTDEARAEDDLKQLLVGLVTKAETEQVQLCLLCCRERSDKEFRDLPRAGKRQVADTLKRLAAIQANHPRTFRIAWSDHADKDAIIASAGDQHYGILIRDSLSGNPLGGFFGRDNDIADAIRGHIEAAVTVSTTQTRDVIGEYQKLI